jgi:uncharacterized protein (TIGR00645 family)
MNSWLNVIEDIWENRIVFGARWLLAPAYFVLVLCLAALSYKVFEEFIRLIIHIGVLDGARVTAHVLLIVDLILVMNLVLMVLFVGYVNFVSIIRPDKGEDWPKWMGYLDYTGLKIQVIGSIIAISAISLLRVFVDLVDADHIDVVRVLLMVGVHLTFVISALVLATVNKLGGRSHGGAYSNPTIDQAGVDK